MAIDGGRIVSYLELDATKYQSAMAQAQEEMQAFSQQLLSAFDSSLTPMQRLTNTASGLQNIGSKLTLGLTAPLVGIGTAASKAAIDFESAFAGVRKTVDATEEQYEALAQGLQAMSQEIPQSATELAGIMEIAGQLGVDQGNLLGFTQTIAGLGVATNLSGEEAATMLAQYANVMNMPLDNIDRLGSTIVALGNNTATTEKDITEMAQRLAGTGNLIGLDNAQVMGLSATMSALGINAEAGGSAMSRTLQTMQSAVLSGGDTLESFAQIAGTSAQAFAEAWRADPMEALNQFLTGVGRINDSGGDATAALEEVGLSDTRITDTVLRLSGAEGSLADNISLANTAWEQNSALQAEAEQRYATTESRLQIAQNSINNMMTNLGEAFLPVIGQVADAVSGIAQGFASMDEGAQQVIVTVGGLAAAAGPLMTIGGTLIKLMSGPAGWVTLLAGAGVAAAVALNTTRQAAVRANLEGRFGDIALSAQEMDDVIAQLLERDTGIEALITDADDALQTAKEQLTASAEAMDKLWIKTQLGYDVDGEELKKSAAQLALDVSDVIEAQQVKANLTVDALFGAGDEQGEKIKSDFDAYFSQLDAEATGVGLELARLINDALVDGIIDADEQAAIEAQYQKLNSIKTGVVAMEARGAQLRFDLEAQNTELTPETLTGLLERGNEVAQANADFINQQYEDYYTLATNIAAAEGRGANDPQLQADLAAAQKARDEQLASIMTDNATSLWDAVGSRVTAGYASEMQEAKAVAEQARQTAAEQVEKQLEMRGMSPGDAGYAESYQEAMAYYMPEAFANAGWGDIMDSTTREGIQQMYASLEPLHDMIRQLAQEQGDALAPELQSALSELNLFEMLATDTPTQAGSMYAENLSDQMHEAGVESGQAAAEGMQEGVQEGMQAQASQQQTWAADALTKVWQATGQQVGSLTGQADGEALATAMQNALTDAYARLANEGIDPTQDTLYLAETLQDSLREQLQAVGWDGIVTPQMQAEAQAMYEPLAPLHETLQAMAQSMGDDMPAVLQEALGQLDLLQMMSLDNIDLASMLAQQLAAGTLDAQNAGQDVADSVVAGLDTAQGGASEAGGNAGAGFVQGASGYVSQAYQMGYSTARNYVQGAQRGLDAHSPSRATAQLGRWATEGFTGAIRQGTEEVYDAGYAMAQAALTGVAEGQDSHSPSRAMALLGENGAAGYVVGFAETAAANRQTLKDIIKGNAAAQKEQQEKDTQAAKRRAAAAAKAQEAARQQAVLEGIQQTAAATLAADQASYQQRMDALNGQYQSLMDFAGAHAIWYQDDKGDTEVEATKARYDALIEAEKERYESQVATLSTDAQKEAAKEAYNNRVALLKQQRDEETEALQKQYNLQKEMATDWLNYQKSLLSEELSAKRAAYEEDDYQDELAALQKKQRQSKSAREKRELQEQIDKMIRDHALEMEEAALQETLSGYDALIEAVNKGLIGLGDLTGNDAFGALSFGTAGLAALDNLTSQQLENVLASLERSALSEGVGATVSAAQMAAALASSGQTSSVPTIVQQGGNQYTIDLRGALVRDDSDITRIVDELEARMRSAAR
ncbi:MAG: phage tail tape measure protein [Clostridia bacterium]|nr:phage tail tape measure protein [Clostridia bacterium]